jgi:membrane fusion protein
MPTAPVSHGHDLAPQFLEPDPPPWAARGVAYVLILLFTAGAAAAALLHLPETVSSPFVLVPIRGADAVRAFRSGMVSETRIAEGQLVTKGATMFVIRSQDVGDRSSELETLENQLKNGGESASNARRKRESERRADQEESRRLEMHLANLERTLVLKRQQLSLANRQLQQFKKATDEGLTSQMEYSNYEQKANQAAVDLQQTETDQKDSMAAIEKLRHESDARAVEFRETERSLTEAEEKAKIRIKALSADPGGAAGNDLIVMAPCSGTVLRMHAQRPGAVVHEGDVLSEVGCSEERLQAELTVPQSGLAQIRLGQPVKLLYDAFPYQRYGVRFGTVRWTSPASVVVNSAAAFRVFVELSDEVVRVNGQPRPLMPGMGGMARVMVGSRSLISYAFEPLRQLRENVSAAPTPHASPSGSR